ncbi:MAG: hypothetical protein AAGG08_00590 [Actinomycetota bacterium]
MSDQLPDRAEPGVPQMAEQRLRGSTGSSTVAAIAIIFSATFLGLLWLARDVDRARSNEGAAEAIAFQSARAGAQAASIGELRGGVVVLDAPAVTAAASGAASRLFASYGVDGSIVGIDVDVATRRVRVEVQIVDGGISVSGVGVVTVVETP